jgi:hypothetical protein
MKDEDMKLFPIEFQQDFSTSIIYARHFSLIGLDLSLVMDEQISGVFETCVYYGFTYA